MEKQVIPGPRNVAFRGLFLYLQLNAKSISAQRVFSLQIHRVDLAKHRLSR